MKKIFVMIGFLSVVSAQAATYNCNENDDSIYEESIARTSVIVEELSVDTAKLTIERSLNGNIASRQVFIEKVNVDDVHFSMNSTRSDMSFYMYLDEADQAGISYLTPTGVPVDVRLTCLYKE